MGKRPLIVCLACAALAAGTGVELDVTTTTPATKSAFAAGEEVTVAWAALPGSSSSNEIQEYNVLLKKEAGDHTVVNLCTVDNQVTCPDMNRELTVVLPTSGLETGTDYSLRVELANDAENVYGETPTFGIVSDADGSLAVTHPQQGAAFDAGETVDVTWVYAGENEVFDVYLVDGAVRASDNLCGTGHEDCVFPGDTATVTLPSELVEGADYRILVVDRVNDDAHGYSVEFGVTPNDDGGSNGNVALAAALGGCAMLIVCLGCLVCGIRRRKSSRDLNQDLGYPSSSPRKPDLLPHRAYGSGNNRRGGRGKKGDGEPGEVVLAMEAAPEGPAGGRHNYSGEDSDDRETIFINPMAHAASQSGGSGSNIASAYSGHQGARQQPAGGGGGHGSESDTDESVESQASGELDPEFALRMRVRESARRLASL